VATERLEAWGLRKSKSVERLVGEVEVIKRLEARGLRIEKERRILKG
jgi:hypothetical protein